MKFRGASPRAHMVHPECTFGRCRAHGAAGIAGCCAVKIVHVQASKVLAHELETGASSPAIEPNAPTRPAVEFRSVERSERRQNEASGPAPATR